MSSTSRPRWPVYQPGTRRCIFVGAETGKRELYCVERGESLGARRLEVVEHLRPGMTAQQLGGLSFSPDGRYLLFQANRPDRRWIVIRLAVTPSQGASALAFFQGVGPCATGQVSSRAPIRTARRVLFAP